MEIINVEELRDIFRGENVVKMENYYQYEEISLSVVKKLNKKKVFFLLLIVLFILLMILLYVFNIQRKMSKINNYASMRDNTANMQTENNSFNNLNNNGTIIAEAKSEIEKENKLPVLTQVGRNNMQNIYVTNEKIAYITFDDGPSSNITPQILNILDEYQIKATFFVLGCNVARYPHIVKQEYDTGHYIANHGYSHAYDSIYSSPEMVLDEYVRTEIAIKGALGIDEYSSHLFRFPGGSGGKKYSTVKAQAKQLLSDNDVLDWNALTNDSVGRPTEESIINDLISTVGTKNSVVILMHDAGSKQLTATMLPHVLNYLIQQGYKFKTFYDVIM